ncbi:competence protein ComEA [Carnobacterium iners]|uniref:Competence protein ComEA n=1 Tax=Carnobacterium iners TaxID=1073423 RepID=A0A1X7NKQ2_9LACT|nr:ComEA family DNA-binding protein [Carnobacterium iners]SEK70971.1 competence protein ComEA [Carnobacterium iners]SMH38484.1 competence protein ComEA [Carnobacterium iners]
MIEKIKIELVKRKSMIAISLIVTCLFIIFFLVFSLISESETTDQLDESLTDFYISHASSLQSSIVSDGNESKSKQEKVIDTSIFVDIKGAVQLPGVYEINSETRLTDVIILAGGFLPTADQSMVNLSQKLTDQMMITIPAIGVEKSSIGTNESEEELPVVSSPSSESNETQTGKVNINTADISELQTLSGIGEKKAERILQYRQEKGSFKAVEELKEVSGIGDKTFEALAEFISVGTD